MKLHSSAVLNVFDYNKNNGELILTKQVPNIFDGGQSIQLDWITNKIYWVTCNDRDQYSIKVTDTSFEKTDYVIENFEHFIYEVKIYPKEEGSQIFFISNDDIYWTYCSPGSTVNLVFESPKDEINPEQLAIDYELEELCWTSSSGTDKTTLLRCIDIAWSAPPLDVKDIVTKRSRDENINSFVTRELVVFSNEFYWIGKNLENKKRILFYQAANENPVEVTELHSQLHYEFIFLNCPCTRDEVASSMVIIVSLGVFAVCSGMPGKSYGLIGMPLMMEDKLNCRTIDPNELSSTFLFVDSENVSRLVGSSGNYTFSDIEIQDSTNIYKDYNMNGDFTYNCVENTAYILKTTNKPYKKVLNVFDYNKTNGVLVLKKQIPDMFFDAYYIQSDWVTGNIYWATRHGGIHHSIKVTDKSFNEPEYVIDSLDKEIIKLRVYGEKSDVLFSMDGNKTVVEVADLHQRDNFLNFMLLNCPCTGNDYMELVATSKLKTLQKLKKVAHGLEQVEDPIKVVTVVEGEEREILGKDAGIIYDN
ncbi:hypothetical protein HCN44_011169 [Aphidius gifuensis]|uniref:Uncharacterized protein n=1 Tax=Aphidius gifuensis TaxID=684658 RepID=A0A834XUX1_APHGI|nr:hypothetical protein HCN44_011169 [Aphidius gifuensis]